MYLGVSKNRGGFSPKMDGENFMEHPIKMDDLGGKPSIFGNIHLYTFGPLGFFNDQSHHTWWIGSLST